MSEARDRKMKRKRKLDELKAEKILRACKRPVIRRVC